MVAVATDSRARDRVMQRLRAAFDTGFADVRARTERLPNGPPVGYPIQFRVSGEDPRVLARIAEEVAGIVRSDPHVYGTNLDWYERQRSVHVVVDQDKARALGLSSAQVRQGLHQVLSGVTVTELREGERTIELIARAVEGERNLAAAVADVHLHTANGRFVPVSQVASVELALDEARVWRRDRLPTITVRADVVDGVQAPDVTDRLLGRIDAIRARLAPGYYIDAGGSWYESRINEGPMMAVMPLMGLAIVTLLMIQLQSFGKVLLVLLTAPLGLIGVVAALLAFDAPLGFVAQLGIIAGLHFPAERLPAISQRLRDMHTVASDLDSVELGNVEPAIRFDPSWPEAGAK